MDYTPVVAAILITNTIIAILVMLMTLLLKKGSVAYIYFSIIFLIPIGGIILLTFSHLTHILSFKKKELSYKDISFDTTRQTKKQKADVAEELNKLLPLEESFNISETKNRREAFLNVLKYDYSNNIASIKQGLDNEDSETSHYAASAVMSLSTEFLNKLTLQRRLFDNKSEANGAQLAQDYLDTMRGFFHSNLMGAGDRKKYTGIYVGMLDWLYGNHPTLVVAEDLALLIDLLIERGSYADADIWSRRAIASFPADDLVYNITLKLYYSSGERDKFMSLLKEIMGSDLSISNDTLQHIRYFTYRG